MYHLTIVIIIRIFGNGLKLIVAYPRVQFLVLFFLIYINYLPTIVNEDNNKVLYAVDASIVVTDSNRAEFNLHVSGAYKDINNWFKQQLTKFNIHQNSIFRSSKHHTVNTKIHHKNEYTSNVTQNNFLGLTLDDTLTWKQQIDILIKIMSSMSYAMSQIKYTIPIETFKLIYYAHVHSLMS